MWATMGQVLPQDTAATDPHPWRPSLVRLGYDFSRPGVSLFSSGLTYQEGSAEIDFKDFFLVSEFGFEEAKRPTPGYESRGAYYRVGVDVNLIKYDQARNVITFGVRYAASRFSHDLNTSVTDDFQTRNISQSESGVTARWFETVLGMKVRVWKQLFMGYGFRLKFANNVNEEGLILPYEMPGFGRLFNDGREKRGLALGFHYALYWNFKLRDKPVPVRKFKPRKQFDSPPANSGNRGANPLNNFRNNGG